MFLIKTVKKTGFLYGGVMGHAVATLVVAFFATVSQAATGAAAEAKYQTFDFNAEVPGLAGRTWLDLLRQALPDAKTDPAQPHAHAEGPVTKPIRIMPGDHEAGDDKAAVDLANIDAARVEIDGKPRWVALGEQDGFGLAPLMLFDGDGKLLDAVDVVADQHTSMDNAGPLPLGGGAAIVGIRNWHDNSSQSYDDLKLVLIAKDRFSLLDEQTATGERAARLATSEGLTFSVSPDPGKPFARIEVVLERQKQRLAEDGETKVGKPVVMRTRTSFRWSSVRAKYEKVGR
jgi:hypothetical protein